MSEIKQKAISFNGSLDTKDTDGERRILFVASSNNVDRHHENVDVKTLRLPLKGGGTISVGQIGEDGVEGVDIPLMLNHSADVRDVVGSVRKAYFENGELVFEAGISSREIAQEMLTLIEEGHLSNAFSITMIDFDFDYDAETIRNAEVIEVSIVYRGSNKEARLLAIKSLLGDNEMQESENIEQVADVEVKPVVESTDEQEVVEEAPVEEPAEEEPQQEESVESETEAEEPAEEAVVEEAEKTDELKDNNEEIEMNEIAKDTIVETAPKAVVTDGNYLASKKALADFKEVVLNHHRGSNNEIMKAWTESLKSKAISGDAILPTSIESIFFKAWEDNTEIASTFRQLNSKAGYVYAMELDENGSAKGHTKGSQKANQSLEAVRRDIKALCIYKKLPIDLQDLFDDESGELLTFRVEELASRIAHAIAVGAIVGDTTNGYIASGRGLNSMKADILATSGFGKNVATKIEGDSSDTEIIKAIKTLGAVEGERKVLVVPKGWKTDARLALIELNYPVADIAEFVGATKIFELPELADSGLGMVAYAEQSYVLVGERTASVRTDFDTTYNQDIMLMERFVGGSAQGYKTVAGYVPASAI